MPNDPELTCPHQQQGACDICRDLHNLSQALNVMRESREYWKNKAIEQSNKMDNLVAERIRQYREQLERTDK